MGRIATITAKKQLTLPAAVFREARLKEGQKVLVEERNGEVVIKPLARLVRKLSGSLKVPSHWRGKDLEEIIKEAKREYFRHRKSS